MVKFPTNHTKTNTHSLVSSLALDSGHFDLKTRWPLVIS